MTAEEYTRRLAAGLKADTGTVHDPGDGSVPTYFPGPGETDAPDDDRGLDELGLCGECGEWTTHSEEDCPNADLTPEEEATLTRRWPAEDALEKAGAAAAEAGEGDLAVCLQTLFFLWDLGEPGIAKAAALLSKAVADIKATLDESPEVRVQAFRAEPDHRIRAKAEAWDALTEHAAHAGAELNTPEVGEELRLLREIEKARGEYWSIQSGLPNTALRVVQREAWEAAWAALRAFRERTAAP